MLDKKSWCNINIPFNFVFLGEDAINKSLTLRQRIITILQVAEDNLLQKIIYSSRICNGGL